jgi:cation diffusion facilitator family transporter
VEFSAVICHNENMQGNRKLTRYAWLSIGTALAVIVLKITAYRLTGSIGLLSDALESGVNLVAAVLALIALTVAARPPDKEHAYGHTKVEYFAGGVEGLLILVAAGLIAYQAWERLWAPQPLEQFGLGLGISVVAALGNFAVARVLQRAGQRHGSMTLQADAKHLLADVWTTAGVLIGLAAVALTGWIWLDPVIALIVAAQIVFTGWRLLRLAFDGLMDVSLPAAELARVIGVLDKYRQTLPVGYHALRTRQSGANRFVSVHIQVPGSWSVQQGHDLSEAIERDIRQAIHPASVITHLEPVEDPISWQDVALEREG